MPHSTRSAAVAVNVIFAVLLFACSSAPPGAAEHVAALAAPYPPPPKRAEIPPAVPAADALWQCGHWNWTGAKYVWIHGSYLLRPTPTANWLPGYWEQDASGGWIWTEGHWRS
jgi:WXXGXW repeat (2 copies)